MPIAHPLGANFQEVVAILKIRPAPKWYITGEIVHYIHGLDSAGINFGGDVFENSNTRTMNEGYTIGGGNQATCNIVSGVISYELKENMFLEIGGLFRTYKTQLPLSGTQNNNVATANITLRWNIARRDFNFY